MMSNCFELDDGGKAFAFLQAAIWFTNPDVLDERLAEARAAGDVRDVAVYTLAIGKWHELFEAHAKRWDDVA